MSSDPWRHLKEARNSLRQVPNDHPLRIAARTYALSLSLSLGPAIVPVLTGKGLDARRLYRLLSVVRKELSLLSFATSMTIAVAGGAALDHYWRTMRDLESIKLIPARYRAPLEDFLRRVKAILPPARAGTLFFFNAVTALLAVLLMQSGKRSLQTRKASIPLTVPIEAPLFRAGGRAPPTLDLSLLLFVRALDAGFRGLLFKYAEKAVETGKVDEVKRRQIIHEKAHQVSYIVDSLAFAAASGRIMFCFFYLPFRHVPNYY